MRIERIDIHLVSRDFLGNPDEARRFGGTTLCGVACSVFTDDGVVGYGFGWSIGMQRARMIVAAVREVAELVLESDPLRIEDAWQRFFDYSRYIGLVSGTRNATLVCDSPVYDYLMGPAVEVHDGWVDAPMEAGIGPRFPSDVLAGADLVTVS